MNRYDQKSVASRRRSIRSASSNFGLSGNIATASWTGGETPPADIPLSKWNAMINEEQVYSIVNSIRQEILCDVMNIIYSRYLEETAETFVVDCSYRAWMKLFNFMYLKHDPGESLESIAENWSIDKTPNPIPSDPWVCRGMSIHPESPVCTAPCSPRAKKGYKKA